MYLIWVHKQGSYRRLEKIAQKEASGFQPSTNIIKMIKLRGTRWFRNVACRGDITNGYKILHNKQNNVIYFHKPVNQLSSSQNLTQPLHTPSTCISSFKANHLPCGWKSYNLAYCTLCTFTNWNTILAPVYCLKLQINLILINSY